MSVYMNCVIEYPSIYNHYGNVKYCVVVFKDMNPHLADVVQWKPSFNRRTGESREKFVIVSDYKPLVTLIDGDYETLVKYRAICDARNLPQDVIFRGAIADIKVRKEDGFIELTFSKLSDPAAWVAP